MTLPLPASDRTCLVTGASNGIGADIARDLSRRGHHVTLVARSADKLADLADELTGRGGRCAVLPADLGDRVERAALPGRVADLGLVVDVLVNSAGTATYGPIAESDPEAEMAMVELDVMAIVDLCSRFVPGMVERGRGAIMNVASMGAFSPVPGQAGYGAGKAFVLSYTYGLAGELRGTGVHAMTLCPGPVDTGFGERAGFSKADAEKSLPPFMWVDSPEVARVAVEGLDKGRLVVVPGRANRIAASLTKAIPVRLLLPALVKQHPGLP